MGALENIVSCHDQFISEGTFVRQGGRISAISPHCYQIRGISHAVALGDVVSTKHGEAGRRGEIIRIDRQTVTAAPFRNAQNLRVGDAVFTHGPLACRPDDSWLGRIVDALGEPIDGKGPLFSQSPGVEQAPPDVNVLGREMVNQPFRTGVRAIDIFTPLCYGQRFGIFAGSGVGKSTLLAMLTKTDDFDVVVVVLVGERSREVREFVSETIGYENLSKCVLVVATGDESALMRRRAPECGMQIAERFRHSGKKVLLLLDSLTRYAHALRETAIAVDEPPVARGYPSSVFANLPKLLERAGPGGANGGSITAIMSVLVDGDDHNDPVADAVRGMLDGHLVMNRAIADQGRYPPIDPLASISRLSGKIWTEEQRGLVLQLRSMISQFEETRDLRLMGAWQKGSDPAVDRAVEIVPLIYQALTQSVQEPASTNAFAELASALKGPDPETGSEVDASSGSTDTTG
ncbi:MAG: FliI/YscN family ATPase [Rhizobiaceae bacterium]